MDHVQTVGCYILEVHIKSLEVKRGVRSNSLEPPLPTGLFDIAIRSSHEVCSHVHVLLEY